MEECLHPNQSPRLFTKSNGATSVRFQCEDCGAGLQEKSKSGFNIAELKPFDFDKRRLADEARFARYRSDADERKERERQEFFAAYNEYLITDHWESVRQIVLRRDPVCQVCFIKGSHQAHHLTYESFKAYGVSFAVECVGVCKPCHEKLRGRKFQ